MTATGLEAAAAAVLTQAVEMDKNGRKLEAVTCYTEGAGLLIDAMRQLLTTNERRGLLREKAEKYMDRAQLLKNAIEVEKKAGKFHEQILIAADSDSHDYESLFRSIVDDTLVWVEVDDAYIKAHHQLLNFTRFCEFLLRRAPNIRQITLTTQQEAGPSEKRQLQVRAFRELTDSLRVRNVQLIVNYSPTIHDREIRFNNGWIVKIGRGLDLYKRTESSFAIGGWDMHFRKCHETTVDIFHRSTLAQQGRQQAPVTPSSRKGSK